MHQMLEKLSLAQRADLFTRLNKFSQTYAIDHPLGTTGHNVVYKVLDKELQAPLTLKIPLLLSREGKDVAFYDEQGATQKNTNNIFAKFCLTEKFSVSSLELRCEAAALTILKDHDHIPQIHSFSTELNPYLAINFIDGMTIKRYIQHVHERHHHPLKPSQRLRIIAEVADALEYIHSLGFVHGDVKPANILIEHQTHKPFLIDYDIARFPENHPFADRYEDGWVQGTPRYVAPELVKNKWAHIDNRVDIYALGAVCYELIVHIDTPHTPYHNPVMQIKDMSKKRKHHPKPSQVYPTLILPEWDDPIMKAMNDDPDERYQTAGEFRDDLYTLMRSAEEKEQREGITEQQIWDELLSPDIDQIMNFYQS